MAQRLLTGTVLVSLVVLLAGCGPGLTIGPTQTPIPSNTPMPTSTSTPTPTLTPTATSTPAPTLTEGEKARALAEKGVTANADWTPYTEEFDGVKMALVPAGCFPMGSTDEDIAASVALYAQGTKYQVEVIDPSYFADEKPRHKVCFEKPFWIDETEVTNAQFAKFGGQTKWPSHWPDADRPREMISWTESDAFCQKRGARLITEAEWEYAARGPNGLIFPWGKTWDSDLVVWNLKEDAKVGSIPGNSSWVGALDMLGNAGEWVNDWYAETYYGTLADGSVNPQGPDSGTMRALRGASYYDMNPAFIHSAYRGRYYPDTEDSRSRNGGFRCARSY